MLAARHGMPATERDGRAALAATLLWTPNHQTTVQRAGLPPNCVAAPVCNAAAIDFPMLATYLGHRAGDHREGST